VAGHEHDCSKPGANENRFNGNPNGDEPLGAAVKLMNRDRAFTLIEVLVVIVIIGVLAINMGFADGRTELVKLEHLSALFLASGLAAALCPTPIK